MTILTPSSEHLIVCVNFQVLVWIEIELFYSNQNKIGLYRAECLPLDRAPICQF